MSSIWSEVADLASKGGGAGLRIPRDHEAERVILGAILLDASRLDIARRHVGADDFERPLHKLVFDSMEALSRRGDELDLVSVLREVRTRKPELSEVELVGVQTVGDGMYRGAAIETHARHVAELGRRRRLQVDLHDIVLKAGTDIEPAALDLLLSQAMDRGKARGATLPAEDIGDILGRPIPLTPWAAPGLLAEGDIGIISGQGGIGKTWIMLALGLSLAAGMPIFGRFRLTRAYRVAFLDLESRSWECDQRLARLAAGMGLTSEMLGDRVKVIRCRARLDDPRDHARILASLRAWGTDFLLVDSFRRAFRGDALKSEVINQVFCDALDHFRLETGCGTLLSDHHRKLTGERDLDAPDQALFGSVDKRNMVDLHVGIDCRGERLAFIPTKVRHSRPPEAFLLELKGLAEDDETSPVTPAYAGALDRASDRVQDSIIALLSEGEIEKSRGELIKRSGFSERSLTDALSALKGRDRVASRMVGKQAFYRLKSRTATTADGGTTA